MGKEWWNFSVLDTEGNGFNLGVNSEGKKNSLANASNDKSFNEVFGSSFDNMPLRQQIETAYDYYDKPQNQSSDMKSYKLETKPMGLKGEMKADDAILPKEKDKQSYNNGMWDKVKSIGNNLSDIAQTASVGYATELSLGNFDETMGGVSGLATGNPNNYKIGRDATRQLQNELKQKHPYIYGGTEFLGAMQSPMHLFKGTTLKQKAINALTDTLSASSGYAENGKDFGENLWVNGAANAAGLGMENVPILRAIGATGKKFIKQGINFGADKGKNMLYDEEE